MRKSEFEKEVYRYLGTPRRITRVYCIIWHTFDSDNNDAMFVSVVAYRGTGCGGRLDIFESDYLYDYKEALRLQKYWLKKVKGWVNINWGIGVMSEESNV